jgi:predicted RNA-binding Zn-ribbon protein involved in translation (DUF1610 family)
MERRSMSDFACPQCGNAFFDSIVTGPAPADPQLAAAFARAVDDGLIVHEPSSESESGSDAGEGADLWRCSSCGHRFGDDDAVQRQAWIPADVQANLDLRPTSTA